MKTFCWLFIAVLLILVIGITAGCEKGRGNIEGIVTDESGKPVARAIVRAERAGSPGVLIRTDETGHYSFNNVLASEWDVEFYTKYGVGVGLETVTVRSGETTRLDFAIGAKPPPPGLPRLILPETTLKKLSIKGQECTLTS
jgi:hypothetical protein